MPRRRLPPYVQVLWADKGKKKARGYRGWAMAGKRRVFGPTRAKADEAHQDALRMRKVATVAPSWSGTVKARADEWLAAIESSVTDDTLAFYRSKLANVYLVIPETMPLERLDQNKLQVFVREALHTHGLGARSIQHCRRVLNRLFVWLGRRGGVDSNPVGKVDWPKVEETDIEVMHEVELRTHLANVTDPYANALAVFFAYTGLRRSEVARLSVSDLDLVEGVAWVQAKTKNRSHPLDPEAVRAARTLVDLARENGRDMLTPGPNLHRRRQNISDLFRKWQRKLGEPRWKPHTLRHSVATIMVRKGVPGPVVQKFLRHASYAMTQKYVHMVEQDVRGAVGRLRLVDDGDAAQHG